jgi:hypothetical protein
VDINIYNLIGQKVAVLVLDKQVAGYHQVEWDASEFYWQISCLYFL